ILPPQIERFFQITNENAYVSTEQTRRISEKLLQRNKNKSFYERRPKYDISECRRGLFCMYCYAELDRVGRRNFTCKQCSEKYNADDSIMYAVAQFHLLFPDKKIRVEKILDWCGDVVSDGYIRKVLKNYLRVISRSRYTHYDFEKEQDCSLILSKKFNP